MIPVKGVAEVSNELSESDTMFEDVVFVVEKRNKKVQ